MVKIGLNKLTLETISSFETSGGIPSRKSSKPFLIKVHEDPTRVPEHCLELFGLMYFVFSLSLYLELRSKAMQ